MIFHLLTSIAVAAAQPAAASPAPAPALAPAPATRPAADPATVAAITALEKQWGEAFVKHDFDFIERIVAPEYRLILALPDGTPSITPRDDWMKNARMFKYEEFVVETVDVNRVGDTAVASVQVRNWGSLRPGELAKPRRSLVTDTWVRRNGQWQVIHRYSHRLPTAPSPPVAR